MRKIWLFLFLLLLTYPCLRAQDTMQLTLQQVVEMAKEQSPQAKAAINRLKNSYWKYETYQSQKLPKLTLNATLPRFNRSIEEVTQPDGTDRFVENTQANYSTNISLSQELPFTGGSLTLNSELRRIDIFGQNESTSYLSNPISIGYSQPIFAFNRFKWDNKIEPLKYKESKRQYMQSMEDVAIQAVKRFFDVYAAQIDISIARRNKANKDTLYKVAKGRYDMGKVPENELLQMELRQLNAELSVEQSELDYQNSLSSLRSFLGLDEGTAIQLSPPKKPDAYKVSKDKVIAKAKQNRRESLRFKRRLLEAKRNVDKARKNTGLSNTKLSVSYGLSNNAGQFSNVYTRPQDQQGIRFGFSLPILDWGRSKARRKRAKANQQLEKTEVKQDKIQFRQKVILAAQEFNMQAKQLKVAEKANKVGQKRYSIAKQRFKIGKVDITDLNRAATERDKNKRSFIGSLRSFWTSKYNLRKLTLYNFKKEQPVNFSIEDVIE